MSDVATPSLQSAYSEYPPESPPGLAVVTFDTPEKVVRSMVRVVASFPAPPPEFPPLQSYRSTTPPTIKLAMATVPESKCYDDVVRGFSVDLWFQKETVILTVVNLMGGKADNLRISHISGGRTNGRAGGQNHSEPWGKCTHRFVFYFVSFHCWCLILAFISQESPCHQLFRMSRETHRHQQFDNRI